MSNSGRLLLLLPLLLAACGKPAAAGWPSGTEDPRILQARQHLTAAGFPFGAGFPKLKLLYNEGAEYHKQIAAAFQEMWRRNLGIDVELVSKEWKVYLDQLNQGDFDIGRRGYYGEYLDPHSLLSLFLSDSFFNSTGWKSPEFDRLIAASNGEADPSARMATLARAERLLLDEAPMFPVYHYVGHNLMKPFVGGVHLNARDLHPLQAVTLGDQSGPLIYNLESEPFSLDPALSADIAGLKVLMHLMEGLVGYDPVDARPVPAAAERWDLSKDGRTWTFHLRPARWSNGDPVTAEDFAYSWRRVVDPRTASTYAHRMFEIQGAREISRGAADPSTLGVRAVDERTFEVTLTHPTPYFLSLICLNLFMPVHRATVEKHGKQWTLPEHYVGNGPYRLVERVLNDRKVFEKNPRYRAAADVKLEKFVFLSVEKTETAFRLYEDGSCHWLFRVPPSQIPSLRKRSEYRVNPLNGTYFYVLNVTRKPLDDVRVRRALVLALDMKKIAQSILFGVELPADRLTPPIYPGYELP